MEWRHALLWFLALSFAVRLVDIMAPPLERAHSWRQATGLMVARNLARGDGDILHPRIDERPETSREIGMEFPLLPWMHSTVSKWFGYAHWHSRLINLVVVMGGLWCFFLILARWHTERLAAMATLVLTMSMWFSFGRKAMPDTFSCALVLMGIESLLRTLERGGAVRWVLSAFVLTLGVLSKLPAAILLFPLPLLCKEATRKHQLALVATGAVVSATTFWWYGLHAPSVAERAGTWYHQGQSLSESLSSLWTHKGKLLERFAFSALRTYAGLAAVVLGLWCLIRGDSGQRATRWMLALSCLGCALLMLRAGFYFHHHDYYIMPFVPALALLAAVGLDRLPRRWAQVVLALLVLEAGLNQQHDFGVPDSELPKLGLGQLAEEHIPRDGHVVFVGDGSPIELYLLDRKGWVHPPSEPLNVSRYTQHGPAWLLLPSKHAATFQHVGRIQHADEDHVLVDLN